MLDLQEAYQRADVDLAANTATQTGRISNTNTATVIFAPALGTLGTLLDATTLASLNLEREGHSIE